MRSARPRELVLLYRLEADTEKGRLTRKVLEDLRIPYREIPPQRLTDPLGLLAGFAGYSAAEEYMGPYPEEAFLLMREIQGKRMDQLLQGLRSAGAIIPLKAVVTESNKGWNCLTLIEELQEEHRTMTAWRHLQRLLQESQGESADEVPAYREALAAGAKLLQSQNFTAEALERACAAIELAQKS